MSKIVSEFEAPETIIVEGGTIATDYGVFAGSLVIRRGRIAAILRSDDPLHSAEQVQRIDARGKVILPGGIDPHCHFRMRTEDFHNGTMGAAAGGLTTVFEMPQGDPPVTDKSSFHAKQQRASAQAVVDYGLWGAAVPDNLGNIPELLKCGVVGVKAFMALSSILLTPSLPPVSEAELWEAMRITAEAGGLLAVHAENNALVCYLEKQMLENGRVDPQAHMDARSQLAEYVAVEQALTLAADAQVDLHIVHLTIARGVARVAEANLQGQRVTAETCPSYLLLDEEDYRRLGPYAKCLPPLRSKENVEKLWQHVRREEVNFISSDHAPYTQEEVEAGKQNIWQAPNGVGSNQVMLPLLLDEGLNKRGLSLGTLVRLTTTNAARRLGLYPRKGTILPGSDADLVIYDFENPWVIDQERLFSRQKRTPYHGRQCRVRVERTLVRGITVYHDDEIKVQPGFGQFVAPQFTSGKREL